MPREGHPYRHLITLNFAIPVLLPSADPETKPIAGKLFLLSPPVAMISGVILLMRDLMTIVITC